MARPRLLSRQTGAVQDAPYRRDMQARAEPLLADAHQVFARERRNPARLGIGAAENDRHQLDLLLRAQLGRTTVAPPVCKPVDAVLIVADDPVAQRLAV